MVRVVYTCVFLFVFRLVVCFLLVGDGRVFFFGWASHVGFTITITSTRFCFFVFFLGVGLLLWCVHVLFPVVGSNFTKHNDLPHWYWCFIHGGGGLLLCFGMSITQSCSSVRCLSMYSSHSLRGLWSFGAMFVLLYLPLFIQFYFSYQLLLYFSRLLVLYLLVLLFLLSLVVGENGAHSPFSRASGSAAFSAKFTKSGVPFSAFSSCRVVVVFVVQVLSPLVVSWVVLGEVCCQFLSPLLRVQVRSGCVRSWDIEGLPGRRGMKGYGWRRG